MKYTPELTKQISEQYIKLTNEGKSSLEAVTTIAEGLKEHNDNVEVPNRSVIAKLSSVGVYKKKTYLTKRGEIPVKKEDYIDKIAVLLGVESELLESLEKVNKSVLAIIENRLRSDMEEANL